MHQAHVWMVELGEDMEEVTHQDPQDELKVWAQVQVCSYLGQPSWQESGRCCQGPPSFLARLLDNFHLWPEGASQQLASVDIHPSASA